MIVEGRKCTTRCLYPSDYCDVGCLCLNQIPTSTVLGKDKPEIDFGDPDYVGDLVCFGEQYIRGALDSCNTRVPSREERLLGCRGAVFHLVGIVGTGCVAVVTSIDIRKAAILAAI